ncbi:hypothetical protein ACFQY9_17060 [Microvirga aerilata]
MADTIAPVLKSLGLPSVIYSDGVQRAIALTADAEDTGARAPARSKYR